MPVVRQPADNSALGLRALTERALRSTREQETGQILLLSGPLRIKG